MVDTAKKCKRPGCNKMFSEADNSETACTFHSGKPIFHDCKKGWECCNQVAYEWPEFEKIKGCCTGKHSDDPAVAQTEFWKSSTVENAVRGQKKAELAQMKTAEDYNREQELKKAAELKAKQDAGIDMSKKPVMTRDGARFICANPGCTKKNFIDEENGESACNYHTGAPVFRDIAKSWSCCSQKPVYDFDDFVKLPTCAVGEHKKKYK